MNSSKTTSVAIALTAALGASAAVHAGTNPFGVTALDGGYMLLADAGDKTKAEGKCGEGKCGADMKAGEGKCGGDQKATEGKCGGDQKATEGKCGGDQKATEGKCGGSK